MFKKTVRATAEKEKSLIENLGSSMSELKKKDSLISVPLSKIEPCGDNARIGQAELLVAIPDITAAIIKLSLKNLLPFHDLKSLAAADGIALPELDKAEVALFDSCSELANSFVESGGYADSPPKVFPQNASGLHLLKFGHRRYIAYLLAESITGISSIDVLVDRDSTYSVDLVIQSKVRIKENESRKSNTIAELILALGPIVNAAKLNETTINKTKLSRETGIERTRLSRLLDIVETGVAEDMNIMRALHDIKCDDIVSLHQLFLQPQKDWPDLMEMLKRKGTNWFRENYKLSLQPAPLSEHSNVSVVESALTESPSSKIEDHQLAAVKASAPTSPSKPKVEPVTVEQKQDLGAAATANNKVVQIPPKKIDNARPVQIQKMGRNAASEYLLSIISRSVPDLLMRANGDSHEERLETLIESLANDDAPER